VVLITTIVSTAKMMNVSRILEGGGITHPFGNPELPPKEEKEFRKRLVEKVLDALKSEIKKTTLFS
jgi:betaine reductase